MSNVKAISMQVRPLQASHLCFDTDGILQDCITELGATVHAVDYANICAIMATMPTVTNDLSRLLWDALTIEAQTAPGALARLRAENRKVALNKAINSRQNAYFAKYANTPAIITKINEFYSPTSESGSKPARLETLVSISTSQWALLQQAYMADNRTGVVRNTLSTLDSKTTTAETSSQTGQTSQVSLGAEVTSDETITPPGQETSVTVHGPHSDARGIASDIESTDTQSQATASQTISNLDYAYRVPYTEAQAQYQRSQISLIDQRFSQFMYSQNLPYLDQIFKNELSSIDADVYRLQIAYMNTILFSPIQGTVTGIYKNPGDPVKAGEPVVRVENNEIVLIKAILAFRGPITVGSNVTINTLLFEATQVQVTGTVVAARGRTNEDDHWDVVIKCNNLGANGYPILPVGYNFDFDDTAVTVS